MVLTPTRRHEYEQYLLDAAQQGLKDWQGVLERWKSAQRTYVLWGYNPPQMPLRLAYLLTYLRRLGLRDRSASDVALTIVREYGALREDMPPDFADQRAETRGRPLPIFLNIFLIPVLAGIIDNLQASGDAGDDDLQWLRDELALTVEPVFSHPEWGAMNRAILRSAGLWYAARVYPEHPDAPRWRQMAEVIAQDNLDHWEIEDATTYHPIWLVYTLRYLELRGEWSKARSPFLHWYLEYFLRMMAPHGTIPDFGDGDWRSNWFNLVACFEVGASLFGDPRYKWAATSVFRSCSNGQTHEKPHPAEIANALMMAREWCDDDLEVQEPNFPSCEVLDDVIGKKIVFRSGWDPESTYLMLNYREEHDWGWLDRRYLRDTISVEEEKMHHGHADENAVVMLMAGGSVLLHEAGYRSGLPSGPFGAYRADYFHNRLVVRNVALGREQDVFEVLRNSGAYRPVRTQKIDFCRLQLVDYSRTRLIDERQRFMWDRVVIFLREDGEFLVVDGLSPLVDDFFTTSCLWHTQRIDERGSDWILGGYDELAGEHLPRSLRLLVRFAGPEGNRRRGIFEIERHYGKEICFHETHSGSLLAGRWLTFITHLAPVRAEGEALERARAVSVLPTSWGDDAFAVRVEGRDGSTHTLLIKWDLERERLSANLRPRYSYESGVVRAGHLETDAYFAHICDDGKSVRFSATVFTRIRWRDQDLLTVPACTFGLQLEGSPEREAQAKWRAWDGQAKLGAA